MFICKDLLERLNYECVMGSDSCRIQEVIYDSRKVTKDCMFICITGANSDGHDYAQAAVDQGARVLVVEKAAAWQELFAGKEVTVIQVENTRYAMAFIAAAYFGCPAESLKVIGITGTKGKSTTAYLIKSILEQAGYKVGLIGTIEVIIGNEHIPALNTTPESFVLQQYFRKMLDAGCEIVVMEASSQGFKLHRTQGFTFEIGIFTNLEPDHIGKDEHASFEEYMACKSLLFKQCRLGIVNQDDQYCSQIISEHTCRLETYSLTAEADIYATAIQLVKKPGELGVSFQVKGAMEFAVAVPSPGRFSAYNALTAIAVCRHFQVTVSKIREALRKASVKGRIEMVPVSDQFVLMIDYAHNAMSLKSLLSTLKEYQPGRLVCLFGCGGNRSRQRRFEMGEISGQLADLTIITADNPRYEEPQDIIEDIKMGITKTTGAFIEISDRKEAIAYAIRNGQPGDVIVLAGKGHEDYQEIKGVKYPLDEREIIKDILQDGV